MSGSTAAGDPMPNIEMYSTGLCFYCSRAKQLLLHKGQDIREIRIEGNHELIQEMMRRSGRRTVPQIFIGDQHVGGYDDLAALNASGELDRLLGLNGTAIESVDPHCAETSEDGPT